VALPAVVVDEILLTSYSATCIDWLLCSAAMQCDAQSNTVFA